MADRKKLVWKLSILLFGGSILSSLCFGTADISFDALLNSILNGPNEPAGYIFWYSRLPRTCACLFSGAALAVSGYILQNVLGNRLASPSIIGVNSGAGLAVTICCALGTVSGWVFSFSAFLGAIAAVLTVTLLAQKNGFSRSTVILSGVAINSLLNALRDAVNQLIPDSGILGSDFRTGGFSTVSFNRLVPAAVLIVSALAVVLTLRNELDILTLGDDIAMSLGLPVKKIRLLFLLIAAVLSGASVSFAGLLSFVGLIVPHIIRQMVGSESRYCLPLCVFCGAGFVTCCDLLSRLIFSPFELPVGIIISIIGGPFFLILLLRGKGGRRNA